MNMSASHGAPKSASETAKDGRPLLRLVVRFRSGEDVGFDSGAEQTGARKHLRLAASSSSPVCSSMNFASEAEIAPGSKAHEIRWVRVRGAFGYMRNALAIVTLVAVLGLAATTASAPKFNNDIAAQAARAMLDGVILGSSAWPSVPVDTQARLQLWSPDCDEDGRCRSGSAASVD
jgi:hypothetical protein